MFSRTSPFLKLILGVVLFLGITAMSPGYARTKPKNKPAPKTVVAPQPVLTPAVAEEKKAEETKQAVVEQPVKPIVEKPYWHKSNLERHWEKHHAEFPEFKSQEEYAEAAVNYFKKPPKEILTKRNDDGDYLFFHPPTKTFGVATEDGAIKTMFRPNAGIKYWERQ